MTRSGCGHCLPYRHPPDEVPDNARGRITATDRGTGRPVCPRSRPARPPRCPSGCSRRAGTALTWRFEDDCLVTVHSWPIVVGPPAARTYSSAVEHWFYTPAGPRPTFERNSPGRPWSEDISAGGMRRAPRSMRVRCAKSVPHRIRRRVSNRGDALGRPARRMRRGHPNSGCRTFARSRRARLGYSAWAAEARHEVSVTDRLVYRTAVRARGSSGHAGWRAAHPSGPIRRGLGHLDQPRGTGGVASIGRIDQPPPRDRDENLVADRSTHSPGVARFAFPRRVRCRASGELVG